MKVTKKDQKPTFTPFKLVLEVETVEEERALMAIARTCDSVPRVVAEAWGSLCNDRDLMKRMLHSMTRQIDPDAILPKF
jgi:hypothetical protein